MPRKKALNAAEKAAAGLCTDCGCRPPAPDRKMCPACLKYHRDKWRQRSVARKAKGLCARCGKQPPRPQRNECADCAAKTHARYDRAKGAALASKRYRARVAAGMCAKCGKVEPMPDHRTCAGCGAKERARNQAVRLRRKAQGLCTECAAPTHGRRICDACDAKKRAATPPDYYRKRYWKQVAAGLCTTCGKKAAAPNLRCCASCHQRKLDWEREERQRRIANGLCGECGTPSPQQRTCDKCRARARRYARERLLVRSKGMPVWEPGFTVYVLATGECLGTYDSREDVALCLAFAKLDREAVEIVTDAPAIFGLVGWS